MKKIGRFNLLVKKDDGDAIYQGDMMQADDGTVALYAEARLSSSDFDDPDILITGEASPDDYVPPEKTTYTTTWSKDA